MRRKESALDFPWVRPGSPRPASRDGPRGSRKDRRPRLRAPQEKSIAGLDARRFIEGGGGSTVGEKTRKLVCQPDVAALVPEALARRYEFFPLRWLWWRAQGGRRRTAFGKGPRYAAVRRRSRDQRDPLSCRSITAIGI